MADEKTGKLAASLSGRINRIPKSENQWSLAYFDGRHWVEFAPGKGGIGMTVGEVKSVAASAKTQTADRPQPVKRAKRAGK